MKRLEQYLISKNKYTKYQIQQIIYLFKTISSELSKTLILLIIFHNHIPEYLFSLLVLFFLRSFSGGMHFTTYLGCLLTTISYFLLAIRILPLITISFTSKFITLNLCMILASRMSPVTSKYRVPLSQPKIIICQNILITFLFSYIILLNIFPESPYINIGFWVIILHFIQFICAKLLNKRRKGESSSC